MPLRRTDTSVVAVDFYLLAEKLDPVRTLALEAEDRFLTEDYRLRVGHPQGSDRAFQMAYTELRRLAHVYETEYDRFVLRVLTPYEESNFALFENKIIRRDRKLWNLRPLPAARPPNPVDPRL